MPTPEPGLNPCCKVSLSNNLLKCSKCGALLIRITLQPKQREILERVMARGPNVATKLGGGGSRGSAKTRCGRDIALYVAFNFPGVTVCVVMRNLDDVVENYVEKYRLERPELMKYYYGSSPPEFAFPPELGGSRIIFRYGDSLDDITELQRGPEWFFLIVEQAEQYSERELIELNIPNRWTGKHAGAGAAKTLYLFNPGGQGTGYLRRVFYLGQYKENENSGDYWFQPMFGWDNYEWFRQEVSTVTMLDGSVMPLTFENFYALPGDVPSPGDGGYDAEWLKAVPNHYRFKIFVTQTSEGRKMWAKPENIRLGDLFGRFDKMAGQYFSEVWDEKLCTLTSQQIDSMVPYYWPCWLSGDWGFGHYSAFYWFCTGKLSPGQAQQFLGITTYWPIDVAIIYRELIPPQRTPEAVIGKMIVDATPTSERAELRKWVMGSDVEIAPRFANHTIKEMIEASTVDHGMPRITRAQDGKGSRAINARLLWNMLGRTSAMRGPTPPVDKPDDKAPPLLIISRECPALIASIPLIISSEKNPDDFEKLETMEDDILDACKYGAAEYVAVRLVAPREVRREEAINRMETQQGRYIEMLKFDLKEEQTGRRGHRR